MTLKETISKRLEGLRQQKARAESIAEQMKNESFVLAGAIRENEAFYKQLDETEKAEAEAKEKAKAQKAKSKKKAKTIETTTAPATTEQTPTQDQAA